MNHEEFFLSEQLKSNFHQVFYEPRIKISHVDHGSTGLLPKKRMWAICRQSHIEYRRHVNGSFFYNYFFPLQGFSIWKFTFLAVCIQIIHDVLFYFLFKSLPLGYNAMLDFFKDYAKEVGAGAIMGDSFMMILACLLSSNFATYSLNTNIIALIVSLYFVPYMINFE